MSILSIYMTTIFLHLLAVLGGIRFLFLCIEFLCVCLKWRFWAVPGSTIKKWFNHSIEREHVPAWLNRTQNWPGVTQKQMARCLPACVPELWPSWSCAEFPRCAPSRQKCTRWRMANVAMQRPYHMLWNTISTHCRPAEFDRDANKMGMRPLGTHTNPPSAAYPF